MPKLCPVCGTSYPDALVFCPADATALRAADVQGNLIGSVVADRYLVTDLLGEGGMGTVYLARHVRLPQQAAIKVLRKELLRDAASVARFNREAANASRIDHDRVARVYDFGETDDGVVYLAMEFVQGATLKKIINDGGPMAPERVGRIVRQIAEGLDAAHRLGIVHRDLKPDNVMLIEDADGSERVKVVDFGIAKAFGNEEGAGEGITKTGFVVGTPEFMSPEQLLGGSLDARSDIYALAILAYKCLTGDLPFATNTPDRGMAARLMTPARPLLAVSPDVRWPAEMQAVFDQALAREPVQRQTTAGAFARALAGAIERWQHDTPAATPMHAPTQSATAQPAAASATAPARPEPEVVGPSPSVARARAASPPADSPTPATSGGGMGSGLIVGGVVAALVVVAGAGYFFTRGGPAPTPVDSSAVVLPPPRSTTGTGVPNGATPRTDSLPTGPVATANPAPGTPSIPTPNGPPGPRTPTTSTTPAPTTPAPTTPAPTSTPVRSPATGAPAVTARAAKQTLDSVGEAFDVTKADEAQARTVRSVVRALLPRLGNATDSTWAAIRLIEASLLMDDSQGACASLRLARAKARTAPQRDAVQRYDTQLSCGS